MNNLPPMDDREALETIARFVTTTPAGARLVETSNLPGEALALVVHRALRAWGRRFPDLAIGVVLVPEGAPLDGLPADLPLRADPGLHMRGDAAHRTYEVAIVPKAARP